MEFLANMSFTEALGLYSMVLGPERLVYGFVYHFTPTFRRVFGLGATGKADLLVMHSLVSTFKVVQVAAVASDLGPKLGWTLPVARLVADPAAQARLACGLALVAFGQLLNASIYWAIGSVRRASRAPSRRIGSLLDFRRGRRAESHAVRCVPLRALG
jgi:hypothetical protein